jgi:hypothetical protein
MTTTAGWAAIIPPLILVFYITNRWYKAGGVDTARAYFGYLAQALLGYLAYCLLIYGIIRLSGG